MSRAALHGGVIEDASVSVRCDRIDKGRKSLDSPPHRVTIVGGARDGGRRDKGANSSSAERSDRNDLFLGETVERIPVAMATGFCDCE